MGGGRFLILFSVEGPGIFRGFPAPEVDPSGIALNKSGVIFLLKSNEKRLELVRTTCVMNPCSSPKAFGDALIVDIPKQYGNPQSMYKSAAIWTSRRKVSSMPPYDIQVVFLFLSMAVATQQVEKQASGYKSNGKRKCKPKLQRFSSDESERDPSGKFLVLTVRRSEAPKRALQAVSSDFTVNLCGTVEGFQQREFPGGATSPARNSSSNGSLCTPGRNYSPAVSVIPRFR
nr:hypothetical protein Iba_chr12cCG13280 [Ipomoea batatas]